MTTTVLLEGGYSERNRAGWQKLELRPESEWPKHYPACWEKLEQLERDFLVNDDYSSSIIGNRLQGLREKLVQMEREREEDVQELILYMKGNGLPENLRQNILSRAETYPGVELAENHYSDFRYPACWKILDELARVYAGNEDCISEIGGQLRELQDELVQMEGELERGLQKLSFDESDQAHREWMWRSMAKSAERLAEFQFKHSYDKYTFGGIGLKRIGVWKYVEDDLEPEEDEKDFERPQKVREPIEMLEDRLVVKFARKVAAYDDRVAQGAERMWKHEADVADFAAGCAARGIGGVGFYGLFGRVRRESKYMDSNGSNPQEERKYHQTTAESPPLPRGSTSSKNSKASSRSSCGSSKNSRRSSSASVRSSSGRGSPVHDYKPHRLSTGRVSKRYNSTPRSRTSSNSSSISDAISRAFSKLGLSNGRKSAGSPARSKRSNDSPRSRVSSNGSNQNPQSRVSSNGSHYPPAPPPSPPDRDSSGYPHNGPPLSQNARQSRKGSGTKYFKNNMSNINKKKTYNNNNNNNNNNNKSLGKLRAGFQNIFRNSNKGGRGSDKENDSRGSSDKENYSSDGSSNSGSLNRRRYDSYRPEGLYPDRYRPRRNSEENEGPDGFGAEWGSGDYQY